MKMKIFLTLMIPFLATSAFAQGPEITSWKLNTDSLTGYNGLPADVQKVEYTADTVWVSCSDIPDYNIGPWPGDPNVAQDEHFVYAIPRHPQPNTGTPVVTPLGHEALWINGVSVFNAKDARSYNNQNIWHSNAVVVEAPSFDDCFGHPQMNGEYHHHQNPKCLYNMNDSTHHSPLLGFAFDGYPIYGPYGYVNPDGTGGIKRMRSSYQLRDITVRETKPNGDSLSPAQYGPPVSSTYPLGYYVEDYKYVSGSGDLDSHNGRFCVTPEYPNGTYAYFVTIDSTGASAYPYVIGTTYYGIPSTANIGPGSTHNTPPDSAVTYSPTGIENITQHIGCIISPNPVVNNLSIFVSSENGKDIIVELFDGQGRKLKSYEGWKSNTHYTIDMNSYPTGLYILHIQEGNNQITKKLIKR